MPHGEPLVSTKIYYGWRVPLHGLGEFIIKARQQMLGAIVGRVRQLMAAIDNGVVEAAKADFLERMSKVSIKKQSRLNKEIRMAIVMRAARDASYGINKDIFDLECGITFRILGKFAYGFGWGDYPYLDAIDDTEPAVKYCYWNNTDKPEEVSQAEWNKRGDTWDKALKNPAHLILRPISFDPTDYTTEQTIWDAIHPRTGKDLNLFFGPFILDDPSPKEAVRAAIDELKKNSPANRKVIDDLTTVLPRLSLL
jgi:hypothetical protein